MQQAAPFEIVDGPEGSKIGSNGGPVTFILENVHGATMFRRRAVSGLAMKSPTDVLLPQLNQFAGELLATPDMKPQDAVNRVLAIAGSVVISEPVKHEWVVVKVGAIYVYSDGAHVIITDRELQPG